MAAPSYSPYLQFNPDFAYGGRRWGANDLAAFQKLLRKRGVNYNQWARRHPNAAKVFDPTEQMVYSQVQPELDAINYERQKVASNYQRRAHDLAGFTQAIMGMLGEISPAIRGAYGEGAETMQAGGTGFGDVLNTNMAANAAKGNSLLDVIGSPQHLEGGDAGSVLAGVAGWLPAEMMNKQGAAYADAAAQLPKEASFQAQIEMRHQLAEAAQADEDFSQEIMGVLKGMPSIRAEMQDRQMAINMEKQKMRLAQLEADREFWLKQRALALKVGDLKLARKAEARLQQTQQRYNYESQGRDYQGNLMPGYAESPSGVVYDMKDFHVDKKGNIVKNKPGSSSGGFTANQKQEMIERIEEKREDIKASIVKEVQAGTWKPSSGDPKGRAALGRKIFEQYKHLAGTPTAKKRLRKIIAQILAEATKMGPPVPGTGTSSGGGGSFWDVP